MTALIPQPEAGTIDYVCDYSDSGRYRIVMKDVTRLETESYLFMLHRRKFRKRRHNNAKGRRFPEHCFFRGCARHINNSHKYGKIGFGCNAREFSFPRACVVACIGGKYMEHRRDTVELELFEPTAEYAEQSMDYRREFLESGDSMDGASTL